MRRTLALLVMLAGSACSWPARGASYAYLDSVTGQIVTEAGKVCSATTVTPHAIATTKHCLGEGETQIRYQGILYTIERVMSDGEEGLLVKLYGDLSPVAAIGSAPAIGSRLWMIGNPAGLPQVMREARLSLVEKNILLIECHCWHGDSGAGVFNESGQLVGIYFGHMGFKHEESKFTYPFAYRLTFTADQWKAAQ